MNPNVPFAIDPAIERLRTAVAPLPPAVLFALAERGYRSPFEVLVGCLISIRTREEVTLPTALRLFDRARTPSELVALTVSEIDALIAACTFHETKAVQVHTIARRLVDDYQGELPCERAVLLSFAGVGPKCAALVLGIACGQPWIAVDIHVHRVTNRWGYVATPTPERTMEALATVLPQRYWVELNRLLVPFGKYICTGTRPRCSTCPLQSLCPQIGVTERR